MADQISNFNVPSAPLDPTTSDKAWNLMQNQVKQLTERYLLLSKNSLRINGFFLGLITFSPDEGVDDFTDARYWVNYCQAGAKPSGVQLVIGQASMRNVGLIPQFVVATNLSELKPQTEDANGNPLTGGAGTHTLAENTPVIVFVFSDPAIPTNNYYVFVSGGGSSDQDCIVSITGTTLNGLSCGKGKYKGAYYAQNLSTPIAITTDISNSELTPTTAFDCLVVNMAEVNGTGHYLTDVFSDQSFFIGRIIDTTPTGSGTDPTLSFPVVAIDGKQWKAC